MLVMYCCKRHQHKSNRPDADANAKNDNDNDNEFVRVDTMMPSKPPAMNSNVQTMSSAIATTAVNANSNAPLEKQTTETVGTEISYPSLDIAGLEMIFYRSNNAKQMTQRETMFSAEGQEGGSIRRRQTTQLEGVVSPIAVAAAASASAADYPQFPPVSPSNQPSSKQNGSISNKVKQVVGLKLMKKEQSDPVPDEEEEDEDQAIDLEENPEVLHIAEPTKDASDELNRKHKLDSHTKFNAQQHNGSSKHTSTEHAHKTNGQHAHLNTKKNNKNLFQFERVDTYEEPEHRQHLSIDGKVPMGDTLMGFAGTSLGEKH
ncbi:hypothetical protein RFI_13281 [Reticulomyxa filosa]|uniref:Uncharacterized protein n=1 Tax=Reticulomyxa filosa TaxID=46433 RepID=X6NDD6_RETFI|nr:hypothetical protein RFI_13281 [Reticulomyxa filosa]|eukprot:ETO23878.1 hypothetical protein RFI_13281 [Reticulomyxa filosa]